MSSLPTPLYTHTHECGNSTAFSTTKEATYGIVKIMVTIKVPDPIDLLLVKMK